VGGAAVFAGLAASWHHRGAVWAGGWRFGEVEFAGGLAQRGEQGGAANPFVTLEWPWAPTATLA
ncbi:hypothetical protein NLX62_05980, partial [Mycobacteriaceae bacterium Msp059]|nr:hypothetical protein [Mycobacteriaceae bacterium Msp059]